MDMGFDQGELAKVAGQGSAPRMPDWTVLRARMFAEAEARRALVRAAGRAEADPASSRSGSFDSDLARSLRSPSHELPAINQNISTHCNADTSMNDGPAGNTSGDRG